MSDDRVKWFLAQFRSQPGLALQAIGEARNSELAAVAAVVGMASDAVVRAVGFAMLAQRTRKHRRQEFLDRAIESIGHIPDSQVRARVLASLAGTLPSRESMDVVETLQIPDPLSPELKRRIRELAEQQATAVAARKAVPSKGRSPEIDRERMAAQLEQIAQRVLRRHSASLVIRDQLDAAIGDVHIEGVAEARVGLPRRERVVSSGFADKHGEATSVKVRPSERFLFFVEVGRRVEGAAESGHSLPDDLAAASVIDVVLAANLDGMTLDGPALGQLRIMESGEVVVAKEVARVEADDALHRRRMFFACRAPHEAKRCSMRCSFYCRGVLIQSRHIEVPVGMDVPATVRVDYVVSRTLSPSYLAEFETPKLSIMCNRNSEGTHSFHFYGRGGEFIRTSTFAHGELKDHIARARGGLRHAAWATYDEWTTEPYRFSTHQTIESIMPVFSDLAHRGRVLWDAIIDKLAGGPDSAATLRQEMRQTGGIQLALREAANTILPIALLYDHAFETTLRPDQRRPCDAFTKSLGGDLAEAPCFKGDCPNREEADVVCPGGFWGFRHAIGVPLSIGAEQTSPPEIPTLLTQGDPSLLIGVSTDPLMTQRVLHLANLESKTGVPQKCTETRDNTLVAMKTANVPIVYFYCHGGRHEVDGPFIEVGPRNGPWIARNHLREIRWNDVRPIVFINGCSTTQVTPDEALNLVSAFIATSGASGVIGTEITIFESLAVEFAEAFFVEFIVSGKMAGEALRRARLKVLKDSLNPLGLAYIPFVDARVRLRQQGIGIQ